MFEVHRLRRRRIDLLDFGSGIGYEHLTAY